MADNITLSKAVRSNLLNLQNTASLLGKTQERLATGLKVNSALDNPTNFFTASSLNSRASDLGRLLDSVSSAKSTIEAADKGLTALTSLVENAQATARQALQAPATIDQTTAATASTITGASTYTNIDLSTNADNTFTFDVTLGSDTVNVTLDNSGGTSGVYSIDQAVSAIQTQLDAYNSGAGLGVTVGKDGAGTSLTFTADTAGATALTVDNFAVAGTGNTATTGDSGVTAAGQTNTGTDATTTSVANPKRDEYVNTYNSLLTQIDALAADSSFNGVNLLNGDNLSVLFNEDGTSKLDITGVTYDSAGLGLSTIASGGFDTNTSINSTLDDLSSAVDTLRTQASVFGSNLSVVEIRQDFTKNIINTLQTGASNLTLADTNEEAANLLALQTRQQLSTTALSLASQSEQNVLRLF